MKSPSKKEWEGKVRRSCTLKKHNPNNSNVYHPFYCRSKEMIQKYKAHNYFCIYEDCPKIEIKEVCPECESTNVYESECGNVNCSSCGNLFFFCSNCGYSDHPECDAEEPDY